MLDEFKNRNCTKNLILLIKLETILKMYIETSTFHNIIFSYICNYIINFKWNREKVFIKVLTFEKKKPFFLKLRKLF
jgi:hypothetical protein